MLDGWNESNKKAEIDGIMTKQIKKLGPIAKKWLLNMFNNCIENNTIPVEWLKSHVVAQLMPNWKIP